ncbi:VanZ family protein, partial [bacterium]|nr:VanZ family protein [bacterium]
MNKFTNYLPLFIWLLTIFILSSIPAKNLAEFPFLTFTFNWDKVIHFGLYFVLGLLTYRAMLKEPFIKNKSPWIAILFCVCYGILDELHQLFVPGRST